MAITPIKVRYGLQDGFPITFQSENVPSGVQEITQQDFINKAGAITRFSNVDFGAGKQALSTDKTLLDYYKRANPNVLSLNAVSNYISDNGVLTQKSSYDAEQARLARVASGQEIAISPLTSNPLQPKTFGAIVGTPADNFGTGPEADKTRAILAAGQKMIDIPSVSSSSSLQAGQTSGTPPTISGGNATTTYLTGIQGSLDTLTKNLSDAYQKQLDNAKTQADAAQKNIDAISAKKKFLLEGDVKTALTPFRQTLETAERTRLSIEKNFFDNQAAITELKNLLTDGQTQIEKLQGTTELASVINPQISNVSQQITARVGVLQAVMSARNNQISVAEGLIDRTAGAIAADRKDQLTYYQGLLDFYGEEKDTEGNKLITLTKDQKGYLDAQIKVTSDALANTQDTVNYVKQLMSNPASASAMQRAGINLNMTTDEINTALGKQAAIDDTTDMINKQESAGAQNITIEAAQLKPAGEVQTLQGKDGRTYYFWKKPTASSTGMTGEQLKQFINQQIATPEFQALSDSDKALYIQSQGGTPYDF